MHYRHIGSIRLNDHYIKGVEYIEFTRKNYLKIKLFKLIISIKEILSRLGLITNSLNINILFKEAPDIDLQRKWEFINGLIKNYP